MSNTTEGRQFFILLIIGLATIAVTIFALWVSPYLFVEDTSALYRYMVLKIPAMLIDVFVLLGAIVMMDFLTPEDSLASINQNPMSAAILYSAMLVSVAIAIAFG
jgi:hypothetical protein